MNPQFFFLFLGTSAVSAVILNSLFVAIVLRYSSSSIGVYRWFLISFSVFEAMYATVVFLSLPVHFVADNSWIVFSHGSVLENTFLSYWGASIYCLFYQLWVGFVVVLFVYRYIIVSLSDLKHQIKHSHRLKFLIFIVYLIHFAYCVSCSMYFCTQNFPSQAMKDAVKDTFQIEDFETLGYMLITFKDGDGTFTLTGTISYANHYILLSSSAAIICFCCVSIWRNLYQHSKEHANQRELQIQKQIFFALFIQTLIPLFTFHIPTMFLLSYPLWPADSQVRSASSILSILTTFPKMIDPIVTVIFIHDYRSAVVNIVKGSIRSTWGTITQNSTASRNTNTA